MEEDQNEDKKSAGESRLGRQKTWPVFWVAEDRKELGRGYLKICSAEDGGWTCYECFKALDLRVQPAIRYKPVINV